jgi:HSP20 family molecular chaperone IbpA
LTIEAKGRRASIGEPRHGEFELRSYFRQFQLNDKFDQEKIAADLKHGVLTVRLPKAEEAKPRIINVKVA